MNVPVASPRVGRLVILMSCVESCVFAYAQMARPIVTEGKSISLENGSRSHGLHRYEKNVGVRFVDQAELLQPEDFSRRMPQDAPARASLRFYGSTWQRFALPRTLRGKSGQRGKSGETADGVPAVSRVKSSCAA